MDTKEFFVTCLKDELVLLGEAASPGDNMCVGSGDAAGDFRGEVRPSARLLICRGDHPFAEELMMELRAAEEVELGVAWSLSRLPVDGRG